MRRILFVVEAALPARIEEALRAALGSSLRGGSIEVWLPADRQRTPLTQRAVAVLETFGHRVREAEDFEALARADAVEVWTDLGPERRGPRPDLAPDQGAPPAPPAPATLHLWRDAPPPPALVASSDWLVSLSDPLELHAHGRSPLPAGPLSFADLHRLLCLAARVITW